MTDLWEPTFIKSQLMWGLEPTNSALYARDRFAQAGVKNVLIPGIGYGRNARPFLEQGMSVTGIEISETAIGLARSKLGLDMPVLHGSVSDMPFDDRVYSGIFCFGLIYLLDAAGRAKLLQDCWRQLEPGGQMIFTVISKKAPMFGRGEQRGEDVWEIVPGMKLFFYDDSSIQREFAAYGLTDFFEIEEAAASHVPLPFITIVCTRSAA
jgi:SAM-dependent methyltransferase